MVADEHDSCGIILAVEKSGRPSRENVLFALASLRMMQHRAGFVGGEGDGCGLLVDLPRELWRGRLREVAAAVAVDRSDFFAGHFFLRGDGDAEIGVQVEGIERILRAAGAKVLWSRPGRVRSEALGPGGRAGEPLFWQVAGTMETGRESARDESVCDATACDGSACDRDDDDTDVDAVEKALFQAALAIERETGAHVVSLSSQTAVYKARGTADVLARYYVDLGEEDFTSLATIGHNRYSTNTATAFERVQPFGFLGHNGEINTIARFRDEAAMLGIPLVAGGSDSQDMDRVLAAFRHRFGLSLAEGFEVVFPPIINEIKQYHPRLRDLYIYLRMAWGPLAQGPAAVVARSGRECVAAVDALGLRPLWFFETARRYVFASERGIVRTAEMVADPKPLAPGEKMALLLTAGSGVEVLGYREIQKRVAERMEARLGEAPNGFGAHLDDGSFGGKETAARASAVAAVGDGGGPSRGDDRLMAACGWRQDDVRWARAMAESGAEPIYSLGYDNPLAALSDGPHNLADFFKETVAVVTNPSIDREREIEHFSTRSLVGARTSFPGEEGLEDGLVESGDDASEKGLDVRFYLPTPLILGGSSGEPGGFEVPEEAWKNAALALRTLCLEDCISAFDATRVARLNCSFAEGETVPVALDRLGREAVAAVGAGGCGGRGGDQGRGVGATLLVLSDGDAFAEGRLPLDPHLATAAITKALANLRRRVGIIVSSAALRNLHDVMVCLGLGADAVHPYLLWQLAWREAGEQGIINIGEALRKGIEKVLSTLGIHELFGYSRLFSSIGLAEDVAAVFATPDFGGSKRAGLGWEDLAREARLRSRIARGLAPAPAGRPFGLNARVWKTVHSVARGTAASRAQLDEELRRIEEENPVSLRHVLDFACDRGGVGSTDDAAEGLAAEGATPGSDAAVGGHSLPFFIASMSFGSQSETAFRAYAEAAHLLNILCLNGEGGEIADILGRYVPNRGIQIASGRFGINVSLLNGGSVIEIKVGQGAKPGEGGHLPGAKVSAKVAAARHAKPGVDLISPSNNHDIYSIEDLAQFITELKTANPRARVAVKAPVVPGIGTIAVGIVKAGADIVSLSGFDGGTGAARAHALRHAGLPVEIGIVQTHRALVTAGLREMAEVWADGGVKSGRDALKLMLLGANRVGFGTLAMFALGCTACHSCHKGTCHVGIATQIGTVDEAREKGLHSFSPLDFEESVGRLVRLFEAMGDELRHTARSLGAGRVQDLVGRTDLLRQARMTDRLDLTDLLAPARAQSQVRVQAQPPAGAGQNWGVAAEPPHRQTGLTDTPLAMQIAKSVSAATTASVGPAMGSDRALVTSLSGELARRLIARGRHWNDVPSGDGGQLRVTFAADGGAAGNGFAAFNAPGVDAVVAGGAQDGAAKSAAGGRVVVLKAAGANGERIDGSAGKSFAYGAQEGLFIVQGNADSRCGIRLSGADVVVGGGVRRSQGRRQSEDEAAVSAAARRLGGGNVALDAAIKGFAFEYMTGGRAIVLGDPGPWICSGMTGGVVYVLLRSECGLDEAALARRVAKGAKVTFCRLGTAGERDLEELLTAYAGELRASDQPEEAAEVLALLREPRTSFIAVRPLDQASADDGEVIPLDQFPRNAVFVAPVEGDQSVAPGWVAK